MATLFYGDLRRLIEEGKKSHDADVRESAKSVEKVFAALEDRGWQEHDDLWTYDLEDSVHPARRTMNRAAKTYHAAKKRLDRESTSTKRPKGRYELKAEKANPKHAWHEIPEEFQKSCAIITAKLINREELDKDMHYWGNGQHWEDFKHSVMYYLVPVGDTNTGLVMEEGGGWMMLKKHLGVGIDAWNRMLETGVVPETWLS